MMMNIYNVVLYMLIGGAVGLSTCAIFIGIYVVLRERWTYRQWPFP